MNEDIELTQTIFDNVLKDYIKPEIDRRLEQQRMDAGTTITQFQVIMNVGQQNEVRLNDEVKVIAKVRATRTIEAGEHLTDEDFSTVEDLCLTDDDKDAGHITGVMLKGEWHYRFDFRRNGSKQAQAILTAKEFLHAAEAALLQTHIRAFHDNLFEAVEKAVIATLIFLPDEQLLKSKKHKMWQSKINLWSSYGNIDKRYVDLFNRLTKNRNKARYSYEAFEIDIADAELMLSTAQEFINGLDH